MIVNPSETLQALRSLISSPDTHYVDLADAVMEYRKKTNTSERTISAHTTISKTEVHRLLEIARLSPELKEASKVHKTEKYVLVTICEADKKIKEGLEDLVLTGQMRNMRSVRRFLKNYK